jgi:hypothetical protein
LGVLKRAPGDLLTGAGPGGHQTTPVSSNSRSGRLAAMDDYEIESTRRSIVMAGPGKPIGWTTDQALEVVEALIASRQRVAELERGARPA